MVKEKEKKIGVNKIKYLSLVSIFIFFLTSYYSSSSLLATISKKRQQQQKRYNTSIF